MPSLYTVGCCLVLMASVLLGQSHGQQSQESRAAKLRREMSATRRVGYLRARNDRVASEKTYVLKDAWDKETYQIVEETGLDLTPFVDRYISLHGETLETGTTGQRRFVAERVTALDDREPADAGPAQVQLTAFDSVATRPAASREEPRQLQLAALTDGLPSPSEVLQQVHPSTAPNIQIPMEGYQQEPPITGFDWLRPPATEANGLGGRWWVRGEYLLWFTDSLRTPPLLTTSPAGTARPQAGVLGEPGTSLLYGVGSINNDPHSGGRLRGGFWIDAASKIGVEGEAFMLDEQEAGVQYSSLGTPILARPFFDIVNGQETAELVAFPGVVQGTVGVNALTNLKSGGLWMRFNPHGTGSICEAKSGRKLDWVLGYRYMRLEDDLQIRENLQSLDTTNPGTFVIEDNFTTDNKFHGVEVGAVYEAAMGPLFLEALSKIAIGNNHQIVSINGFSDITEMGLLERFPGGVLAQRTNIGTYTRNEMSLIPQLGVTLGWRITRNVSLTAGYSLIYFSNVVRVGDQISTDVNPNLFPPEANPFSGPLRPEFAFRESDFWAHGMSFGADFRW